MRVLLAKPQTFVHFVLTTDILCNYEGRTALCDVIVRTWGAAVLRPYTIAPRSGFGGGQMSGDLRVEYFAGLVFGDEGADCVEESG